jgi:hypothetical protein
MRKIKILFLSAVVVVLGGTVLDLKNAIKRHVILNLERENIKKAMNW